MRPELPDWDGEVDFGEPAAKKQPTSSSETSKQPPNTNKGLTEWDNLVDSPSIPSLHFKGVQMEPTGTLIQSVRTFLATLKKP